ncbi:MAG TPA: Hsp70 family protein, partial [Rhodospirillales bacterium]|nr:Hsp70 family protein [Rhodospirillales bacterium]
MSYRFSLGIDLGTSNSATAITDLDIEQTELVEVTQVVGPNQVGEKPTLPSALYIPHHAEFPDSAFVLPWHDGQSATANGTII